MPYKNPQRRQEYQREYQRRWHQERKAKFFAKKRCIDCGETANLRLSARGKGSLRDKAGVNPWSLSEDSFKDLFKRYATVRCVSCHLKHLGSYRKDRRTTVRS